MEVSSMTTATASKTAEIARKKQKTPSLPTEIIIDIFSRLPAKFVFQMECLSKHYSSCLSKDPYFVEAHFRHSSRLRPSLIVQKPHGVVSLIRSDGDKITVEKVTLPPKIECKNFKIVASCNGIVLVVVGRRCILWNPATVTFMDLPDIPDRRSFRRNAVAWGFGYCNQSHDYKMIIRIAMCTIDRGPLLEFSADVICVNTNRVWRRSVDHFSDFNFLWGIGSLMCFNGAVYLKPTPNYRILTFDLAKEKFAWIPCPVLGEIMVFKGSLTVSTFSPFQTICRLWVLKDERDVTMGSWMLLCDFDFFPNVTWPVGFLKDHQPVLQDQLPSELDDDSEEEERSCYQCYLYDFDTKEIKQIPDLFAYQREEAHYNFTENLVALTA